MYISTGGKTVNQFNNVTGIKTTSVDEIIARTHEYQLYMKKSRKEKNPKIA